MRKIELILVVLSLVCGLAKNSAQEVDTRGFNLIVVGDPQPQTEEQLGRLESEIIAVLNHVTRERCVVVTLRGHLLTEHDVDVYPI